MKKLLIVLTVLALSISLLACANTGGKLEAIQKAGKIVVYTDPNFPPFEYMGENGPEGSDIELAKAIADELGVTVEFQSANFDAIAMSIKGGKGDLGISGLSITEERKKSVDFSDPYINSVQYLILPEDSAVVTVEDLAGLAIGVGKGYTGSFLIEDEINGEAGVLKDSGASFTEYPSALEATLDLKNGKVSAVIMDQYVAQSIADKNEGLKAVELTYADGSIASEEYGVAVPKGNEDLLAIVNDVIAKLNAENQIEQWVIDFSS